MSGASPTERIRSRLREGSEASFVVFAVSSAFGAYFCMYAFRKPFAAASFEGLQLGAMDLKIALVIGQVLGYALSKFVSIKLLSELGRERRVLALLSLVVCAELALLGLPLLPAGGMVVAMFFNGLPLGAVWGLVFSFLEGRRTSELLGAGLSMSYIVASGAVKGVGRWVIQTGVAEVWMPFVVGLVFLLPFVFCVWLLSCLPAPNARDEAHRTRREPMDTRSRRRFFLGHAPGLLALTLLYMLLTAYRDFRDNFAYEIWSALGHAQEPAVLAYTELPVAFSTMLGLGLVFMIRDNRRAFFAIHAVMLAGVLLIGAATWSFQLGLLSGTAWMVLVGSGLYLAYVPFGCILFDRMMAMTHTVGTSVFMIYVADASGYGGSVALLLWRTFGQPELSWLSFFTALSWATAVICGAGFALSALYFGQRAQRR